MNKNELKAEMLRNGDNNESLAAALGISKVSISKKLNAKKDFKQTEIRIIRERYRLTGDDLIRIFFAPQVSKVETF